MYKYKTMSLNEALQQFKKIQDKVPSYRMGQHLINTFIKREDNQENYSKLWNTESITEAQVIFMKVCHYNQWDFNNLVVVGEVHA